jgi:hypothetical protein
MPTEDMRMKKIIFTSEDIQKCTEFSEQVDTSLYAQRNQWDADKRKSDAKIGKLGELVVYYNLIEKFPDLTYPDFKIYKAKEKSWDFDLKSSAFNLHVKTQEALQSAKFGESWIFQYGNGKNRHYDREIFDRTSPNQYVAFVKVNMLTKEGEIRSIVSLDMLHENKLFTLPVLEKLQKANKLAVYFKDLQKHSDKLWQL